jgi:hypothetical protein
MNLNGNRNVFAGAILFITIIACTFNSTPVPSEPAVDAVDISAAEATPTAQAVQHQSIPGELPVDRSSHAGDHDTSVTANQNRAVGGDRFTFGRFERPFNADTMDVYYPYLDIQNTLFYQDDTWIFTVITLKGGDGTGGLAGRYAVEIDADVDGGGDWLVLVSQPASTQWSTAGVQVWFDSNDDVGGEITVTADERAGDGYETRLFDQDQGDDPDLAWARVSPQDPNTVQIAAKRSLLAGDESYLSGTWAGGAILDPALFDLNDHFTHEQAGAALVDLEFFYPIKAISELDSSCRVAIGFQPKGNEPGLCPIAKEDTSCQGPVVCYDFGSQTVCICADQ